jgi:hypothetical protein
VTLLTDLTATLSQGVETSLHRARFQRCRVTITGIAGEFTTIPMKKKIRRLADSGFFEATEVEIQRFEALPSAEILATAPEGVGALDIVYEIRTGRNVV